MSTRSTSLVCWVLFGFTSTCVRPALAQESTPGGLAKAYKDVRKAQEQLGEHWSTLDLARRISNWRGDLTETLDIAAEIVEHGGERAAKWAQVIRVVNATQDTLKGLEDAQAKGDTEGQQKALDDFFRVVDDAAGGTGLIAKFLQELFKEIEEALAEWDGYLREIEAQTRPKDGAPRTEGQGRQEITPTAGPQIRPLRRTRRSPDRPKGGSVVDPVGGRWPPGWDPTPFLDDEEKELARIARANEEFNRIDKILNTKESLSEGERQFLSAMRQAQLEILEKAAATKAQYDAHMQAMDQWATDFALRKAQFLGQQWNQYNEAQRQREAYRLQRDAAQRAYEDNMAASRDALAKGNSTRAQQAYEAAQSNRRVVEYCEQKIKGK